MSSNIIFIHGLKGHPKYTWGGDKVKDNQTESAPTAPKGLFSFFRRNKQNHVATSSGSADAPSSTPFWPEEFLAVDIPEERLWTDGYDASVVEGFFKSGNQNSITQHGTLGYYLQLDGRMQDSMEKFEKVVAIEKETLAEDHPDRLLSQFNLASAYQDISKVNEAIKLFKYVISIEEVIATDDYPNLLVSKLGLARVYQETGRLKEAIELFEHVVAADATRLEDTNQLIAQADLAVAYQASGQLKKAIDLLEYVLSMEVERLSEAHPGRLSAQFQLANAYRANGQIQASATLLESKKPTSKSMALEVVFDYRDQFSSGKLFNINMSATDLSSGLCSRLQWTCRTPQPL